MNAQVPVKAPTPTPTVTPTPTATIRAVPATVAKQQSSPAPSVRATIA
ncbi:MAG: hypothetical protein ACXV4Z_02145 [Halobacteriota archaeon]